MRGGWLSEALRPLVKVDRSWLPHLFGPAVQDGISLCLLGTEREVPVENPYVKGAAAQLAWSAVIKVYLISLLRSTGGTHGLSHLEGLAFPLGKAHRRSGLFGSLFPRLAVQRVEAATTVLFLRSLPHVNVLPQHYLL